MKRYLLMLLQRIKYSIVIFVLVSTFVVIVLWDAIVKMTPVGHASVEWFAIGGGQRASRGPLSEGLHLIWPWNKFYTYDLRLQNRKESYDVVSEDGLHFDIEVNFRWSVIEDSLVLLNQEIGADYLERLLIPEIGSVLRRIVASYPAEAIYTSARNELQDAVYSEVTASSHPNGVASRANAEEDGNTILLSDILIAKVNLPESIQQAIERKLSEAELVKEYAFRIERELLESERKAVEAEGIRRFQETVAPAITQSYLQWRGIEATLELAKSDNAKVVVIGNSEAGLPLILDTAGTVSP